MARSLDGWVESSERGGEEVRSAIEWAQVRAMAADGVSERQIAARLGINRRTVKRLVEADEPPRYRRSPTREAPESSGRGQADELGNASGVRRRRVSPPSLAEPEPGPDSLSRRDHARSFAATLFSPVSSLIFTLVSLRERMACDGPDVTASTTLSCDQCDQGPRSLSSADEPAWSISTMKRRTAWTPSSRSVGSSTPSLATSAR